jgi:hypothetical protein
MEKRLSKIISFSSVLLLITACGGEFSYKRGANYNDLNTTKSTCSDQYQAKEKIDNCLKNSGWLVVDLEADSTETNDELFMEETVSATYTKSESDPFVAAEKAKQHVREKAQKKSYKNITDLVKVNSWWKAGAGMAQLKTEGNACLEQLGDGHYINENLSEVSVGIAKCMQTKKWKLLLAK